MIIKSLAFMIRFDLITVEIDSVTINIIGFELETIL